MLVRIPGGDLDDASEPRLSTVVLELVGFQPLLRFRVWGLGVGVQG